MTLTATADRQAAPARATRPATPPSSGELSHRQILEIITGLLAALFTALLSSTIVSTALPTIMSDLHGTQRQYTWVITASLLAMTISTPIWGKLSDLFNKKLLIQVSIVVFVVGSVGAGLSQTVPPMMAFRAVQGVAMGGLLALSQSIIGAIIPPRQRGRYSGYMGAVMAVSTVSGPLLGGVITESINWRWCFFVCVPLALISLILLQKTLHLTHARRHVKIDYLGAVLIAVASALPMLWVTFAGSEYAWVSWQTAAFLGGFVVAAVLVVVVELKVSEPMVPIRVLRNRTTALMIVAGIGVGVAMFGSSTFLTQYFQLAGGHSPIRAGLMTIPLIVSQMLSSTIGGQIVSRTGRWKPIMVFGAVMLAAGLGLMGTLDHTTPFWHVAVFMAVMGVGVGLLVQNIVLAVQNTVDVAEIGATSATVAFFRSLAGAVGVSILGAVLATHVADNVASGLRSAGIAAGGSGGTLDLADLPAPVLAIVRAAYGDSFGLLFAIAAFISVATLVAVFAVKEVPLRTTVELKPTAAQSEAVGVAGTATVQPESGDQPVAATLPRPGGGEEDRSLDDPAARVSVAALDVLTSAQDRVRQQQLASGSTQSDVAARIDRAGREVDDVVVRFHAELDQIKSRLADGGADHHRVADGTGGDSLRTYEYQLLLDAQQTAERVTRIARTEAERLLTNADAEVQALEERIRTLREVERDLALGVTERLQGQSA